VGKTIKAITAASLLVLLAACGGGGSSNNSTPELAGNGSNQGNNNTPSSPDDQSPSLEGVQWTATAIVVSNPYASFTDMNDVGQIIGWSESTTRGIPSYGISRSIMRHETGTVPGPAWGSVGGYFQNSPLDFNNKGQVLGIGAIYDFTGSAPFKTSETYVSAPGAPIIVPRGSTIINDNGQIAGTEYIHAREEGGTENTTSFARAFLFENGNKTYIPLLPGADFNYGYAMNDHGHVVGQSRNRQDVQTRSYIYSNGKVKDIGLLEGTNHNEVSDINNADQVVGTCHYFDDPSSTNTNLRPYIYNKGVIKEIPTPYGKGTATAINNLGQIIGTYIDEGTSGDSLNKPYIYSGGKIHDADSLPGVAAPGRIISGVSKINNKGQMLASGTENGQRSYFLITPAK
jgi:probable HAF family extracellular repeat protein